jgi:hypothetical protein
MRRLDEWSSKLLGFIYCSALEPLLLVKSMKTIEQVMHYHRKDVAEGTINLWVAVKIDELVMASGGMFGIFCIVWNVTIDTQANLETLAVTVTDAEGHRTIGYCLVPNNRFNKKLTFETWWMRTPDHGV